MDLLLKDLVIDGKRLWEKIDGKNLKEAKITEEGLDVSNKSLSTPHPNSK